MEKMYPMPITTALFDMDGTLLPEDQDVFAKEYFGRIAGKLFSERPLRLLRRQRQQLFRL